MFDVMADEAFMKAGLHKVDHWHLWETCADLLSARMAMLSACEGMSHERVRLFDAQKRALVLELRRTSRKGN